MRLYAYQIKLHKYPTQIVLCQLHFRIEAFGLKGTKSHTDKLYLLEQTTSNCLIKKAVNVSIKQIQNRICNADSGWLTTPETDHLEDSWSINRSSDGGSLSRIRKEKNSIVQLQGTRRRVPER